MYIVGQPRRLSEQAERLPYNVGSFLPGFFLRSDLFGSGQKLLEIGTITNGIPDWINLQTSYGSYLARRFSSAKKLSIFIISRR